MEFGNGNHRTVCVSWLTFQHRVWDKSPGTPSRKHAWNWSIVWSSSTDNKNLASKRGTSNNVRVRVWERACGSIRTFFCLRPPSRYVQVRVWACACVHSPRVCVFSKTHAISALMTQCVAARRGHRIWTYAHLSFDEQKLRPEERGQHLDQGDSPKAER